MKRQITNYIDPARMLETEYGTVTGEEWLHNEVKRFKEDKINAFIETYKGKPSKSNLREGFMALFTEFRPRESNLIG